MKRCLAGIGLLAISYCCSSWSQDAAMFRGNLQHTGVYSAAGVPKFNAIKWKFHTGGRVVSSPAVVDGVVYVYVTVTGALFYDDAHVYMADGSTGRGKKGLESKTLWELHPVTSMAFAPVPKGD